MRALPYLILLSVWCLFNAACQGTPGEMWRSSDPSYVPFTVDAIQVSADNQFVGLTVNEHPATDKPQIAADRTIYLLDLKSGAHRLVGDGDSALFPAPQPAGHEFLYYDSTES